MATKAHISHEKRTASDWRDSALHTVQLGSIVQVNETTRLLRLHVRDTRRGIKFLPGQWLDVHIPEVKEAGGFTVTSTPDEAATSAFGRGPYLELAVQYSARNPPAAWLWRPEQEILGKDLKVRFGGRFTWPPPELDIETVRTVVLVAGGVGINPLMSIASHLSMSNESRQVRILYSSKIAKDTVKTSDILFLKRLQSYSTHTGSISLRLFLTGSTPVNTYEGLPPATEARRLGKADLVEAIGSIQDRESTICYICGPPPMTDEFVEFIAAQDGMDRSRVLCEKWW